MQCISIIDDMSAILNSLLKKLEEPSLHCRISNNEDNNAELQSFVREYSCKYHVAESAN